MKEIISLGESKVLNKEEAQNKSLKIRAYYDEGMPVREIAKIMGIRYQFAYNVVSKYESQKSLNSRKAESIKKTNPLPIRVERTVGTRMFSRMNYQVVRGMMELLAIHNLSQSEWTSIKQYFDNRCAYCGIEDTGDSRNGLVPDHLVPASKGGDFVIGNVIAACHDCNDRRGNKDWESWLRLNYSSDANSMIQKINVYLQKFSYVTPENPEMRITDEERGEYGSIMSEWDELWKRARKLRDKINNRRQNENSY
jgi:hypothetical protein